MTAAAPVRTNVAAICVVRDKDGRVLTVARKEPPHEYALPGGSVDEGETPEQAVRRELREETGLVLGDVWPCSFHDKTTDTWPNLVLTSPEDPSVKVHVFTSCGWTGIPVDAEGPLDASGVAKPALAWLTPPELLAQASKFKASIQRIMDAGCLSSQWNAADKGRGVRMDLGTGDVHIPSATRPKPKTATDVAAGDLDAEKRNALPETKFAWPEQRKFPVHDAAHVRAAASRLAQQVKAGRIARSTAVKIHKRIVAAGKRFGVEVASDDKGLPVDPHAVAPVAHPGPMRGKTGVHVRISHPQHGTLEIRQLKERAASNALSDKDWDILDGRAELADSGSVCLYAKEDLVALADDGTGGPVWNQIATRGTFAGHGAGVFTLDDTVFQQLIDNYTAIDGGQVSFDWEHASEQDPTSGTIPVTGCPAQAWIKGLRIGDRGLYALVDYLEPARTYVREQKYRFVSPAIRFGAKDPKSAKPIGARLTSVAFTNQPFLRGLQSLAAKDTASSGAARAAPVAPLTLTTGKPKAMSKLAHSPHEFMPKIKACLGLHELTELGDVQEKLKALREMCMTANEDGVAHGVDCAAYTDKLRELTSAPMGSTLEDVFNTVEKMIDAAMAEHVSAMHPGASGGVAASAADDAEMKAEADRKAKLDDAEMKAKQAKLAADEAEMKAAEMRAQRTVRVVRAEDDDTPDDGDSTMADHAQMKDVTTKLTAAEGTIAELSLTLKDREGTIVTLKAENERLLKEGKERDAAIVEDRVADAFETYKDAKKLTDGDRDMMKTYCMSNREGFEKLYPVQRGVRKHLLRSLTADGKDVAVTTDAGALVGGDDGPKKVTLDGKEFELGATPNDTAVRLTHKDPTLSMSDALSKAISLHNKAA